MSGNNPTKTYIKIIGFGKDTTHCKVSSDLEHWTSVGYCNEMDTLLRANCDVGDELEMLFYPFEIQEDGTYASQVKIRPVHLTCHLDYATLFKEN